jgi:hypothetical protein
MGWGIRMRHRCRETALVVAALVGAVALVGCVGPTPEPSATTSIVPSTGSPVPDDPSTIPPKPTASGIVPAVTVAGVDVDGMHVSASGFVAGVVEDGGVCVFTFTSASGQTATATSAGIQNVDTTSCGVVQVPLTDFARGTWSVVLNYTPLASGDFTSEPIELEIP